jgi:hypothetical protein
MGDQCFSITVPNTDVTIQGGAGAVDGISFATGANVWAHAEAEMVLESKADMRLACGAVLAEAGKAGVIIGSAGSIQQSAGGGVRLYAGAGITPDTGGLGGPGGPFKVPGPAQVNAGHVAEKLNSLNDGIKGLSDVAGGIMDATDTGGSAFKKAKAAFDIAKGVWDTTKATGAHQTEGEGGEKETAGWAKAIDTGMGLGEVALGLGTTMGEGGADTASSIAAAAGLVGKATGAMEAAHPMSGEALKEAKAAQKEIAEAGVAGGGIAGPVDGPRIHEVAPANIDRECGANMTAKVAGDKTTVVDGKIEYTSGASIGMKAFSKIETQSLVFEAHANIKAVMKGLAIAKVESFGVAALEGKAKFKVETWGSGKIEAKGKLDIETGGKLGIKVGGLMATTVGGSIVSRAANVAFTGKGKFRATAPNIELKGKTLITKDTEIKGKLTCGLTGTFKGKIKGKKGGSITGTVTLG